METSLPEFGLLCAGLAVIVWDCLASMEWLVGVRRAFWSHNLLWMSWIWFARPGSSRLETAIVPCAEIVARAYQYCIAIRRAARTA